LAETTLRAFPAFYSDNGNLQAQSTMWLVEFPSEEKARALGVSAARVYCKPNAGQLAAISDLVGAGRLEAHVATVLPLAEVKKTLELSEGRHTRGKIVLQIAT
jgi:NADPH:quinone reductase-like Zn-dependent oxidoreductase